MPKFWRKKVILFKLESSYGVDPTPTGSANAVQATQVSLTPMDGNDLDRGLDFAWLGRSETIPDQLTVQLDFRVELAGSGSGGTAPAWGPLIKACRFAETVKASTGANTIAASPPVDVGTPEGGFTYAVGDPYVGNHGRLVTLACTTGGASATAEFTVSAPADGSVAAYSQTGVVMTDSGSFALGGGATITPTVTGSFTIADTFTIALEPARVEYAPNSTEAHASATMYINVDGTLFKALGARGNVQVMIERGLPYLHFVMRGLFSPAADAALPTAVLTDWMTPKPTGSANTPTVSLLGVALAVERLEIDMQNAVESRFLVNSEAVLIGDRAPGGQLVCEAVALATLNPFAAATATPKTKGALALVHGTATGGIVDVDCPSVALGRTSIGESQRIVTWTIPLEILPVAGDDEVLITVK